ncbi:mCG147373 [Mus musculus]|nr:mCG147373 [Mus musculus]
MSNSLLLIPNVLLVFMCFSVLFAFLSVHHVHDGACGDQKRASGSCGTALTELELLSGC